MVERSVRDDYDLYYSCNVKMYTLYQYIHTSRVISVKY